ncbi:MAG: 2-deoxyribose-5-phosphate aldolase, partial [Nannocystaceae bacterium]
MAPDRHSLAACLDHTLLRPEATTTQILDACGVAVAAGCATICVAPRHVARAAAALDPAKPTRVCTVIGFPTGAHRPAIKAVEAGLAIKDGATELDMVIALGALIEGDDAIVRDDLHAV